MDTLDSFETYRKEALLSLVRGCTDTTLLARFLHPYLPTVDNSHFMQFYSCLERRYMATHIFRAVIHQMILGCRLNPHMEEVLDLLIRHYSV